MTTPLLTADDWKRPRTDDHMHSAAERLEALGMVRYSWEDREPFMLALAVWLGECGCTIHYRAAGAFIASQWNAVKMRRTPLFEVIDNGGEISGELVNLGLATHYDIPANFSASGGRMVEDVAADLLTRIERLASEVTP